MHELSIALRIVESLEEELAEAGELRVVRVSLRIGPLSGVVPEALHFCWDQAVANTRLAGARLEIERSTIVGLCPRCRDECRLSNPHSLRCPRCRSRIHRIVQGNELDILSLDVEGLPSVLPGESARP